MLAHTPASERQGLIEQTFRDCSNTEGQLEAAVHLLPAITTTCPEHLQATLDAIFAAAKGLEECQWIPERLCEPLARAIAHLPGHLVQSALDTAISVIKLDDAVWTQAEEIGRMVPQLPVAYRTATLTQALHLAASPNYGDEARDTTIGVSVSALDSIPQQDHTAMIRLIHSTIGSYEHCFYLGELINTYIHIARKLPAPAQAEIAVSLTGLLHYFDEDDFRAEYIDEAASLIKTASTTLTAEALIAHVNAIHEPWPRAILAAAASTNTTPSGRAALLDVAIRASQQLTEDFHVSLAVSELVEALIMNPVPGGHELPAKVVGLARQITASEHQPRALSAAAPITSNIDEAHTLLQQALHAASTITGVYDQAQALLTIVKAAGWSADEHFRALYLRSLWQLAQLGCFPANADSSVMTKVIADEVLLLPPIGTVCMG